MVGTKIKKRVFHEIHRFNDNANNAKPRLQTKEVKNNRIFPLISYAENLLSLLI